MMNVARFNAHSHVTEFMNQLPHILGQLHPDNTLHVAVLLLKADRFDTVLKQVGLEREKFYLKYNGQVNERVIVQPYVLPLENWKAQFRGRTRLFTLVDQDVYEGLVHDPLNEQMLALERGQHTVAHIVGTSAMQLFIPVDVSAV
jgi:hypothetical protein